MPSYDFFIDCTPICLLSQYPFDLKVSVNAKQKTVNQTEYISEYTAKATQTNEYEPKQKFLNFFILPRKFSYISRFFLPLPPHPPARQGPPLQRFIRSYSPSLAAAINRETAFPHCKSTATLRFALVGLGKESIDTSNEKGSNVYACSFIILYTRRLVRFDCAMLVKLDLSAVFVPIIKSSQPKNQGKVPCIYSISQKMYIINK